MVCGSKMQKLVAFRVGEHDPRHVALADVGAASAEVEEPLHLVFLIVWVEVEMQSVLVGFGVVVAHEQQRRNAIVGIVRRLERHLVLVGVGGFPAKCVGLEHGEPVWVGGVDDHRSGCPPPAGQRTPAPASPCHSLSSRSFASE